MVEEKPTGPEVAACQASALLLIIGVSHQDPEQCLHHRERYDSRAHPKNQSHRHSASEAETLLIEVDVPVKQPASRSRFRVWPSFGIGADFGARSVKWFLPGMLQLDAGFRCTYFAGRPVRLDSPDNALF